MIDDDIDKIVQELQLIRKSLGDRNVDLDQELDVQTSRSSSGEDGKSLNSKIQIFETSDMNDINSGQSVTIPSGERERVVYYEVPSGKRAKILALGAIDRNGLEYALFVDGQKQLTDWHESPLGMYGDEFSFVDKLNGYFTAETDLTYKAKNTTGSPIDTVGRVFVELD